MSRSLAGSLVAPGTLAVGDVPLGVPEPGEVRVRMDYAAICGSDLHIVFDGMHDPARLGSPGYPGHEGVGTVESVGRAVDPGLVGTPVLTLPAGPRGGCFAQHQLLDARQLLPLPARLDPQRALMAQQLGTVLHALDAVPLPTADSSGTVVVIGAGAAGLFFVQQLAAAGHQVLAVERLHERRRAALRAGATTAVQPVDALEAAAAHGPLALVVDAAGGDDALALAVEVAPDRGTVLCFGYPDGPGHSAFPAARAFRKSLRLQWASGAQTVDGLPAFRRALALVADGSVSVEELLTPPQPLTDLSAAFELARHRQQLKTLIEIG